jgi:formylglycine-generating enzyme required for sulfatase activity
VLSAFGRAYGCLPERLSEEQQRFLEVSIDTLAVDGLVVPIRLALFAEIIKNREWSLTVLRELGGFEGIGITYLEMILGSNNAPPRYRRHLRAAQAVLWSLLPDVGRNIRGNVKSYETLLIASGYSTCPGELDDLIDILDSETRLITPSDTEVGDSGSSPDQSGASFRHYQLTHDYLVPSIREWLKRKKRETRRGRAELLLAKRASMWGANPENRYLPSILELAYIWLLTQKKDWTAPQRMMLKRAGRIHGLRALSLAALITLGTLIGREGYGYMRASALVESLRTASTTDVPSIVERLPDYRSLANPHLYRMLRDSEPTSKAHLHASLALLPVDPSQVDYLYHRMLVAIPAELPVLRNALQSHRSRLSPKLWSVLDASEPGDARLLPAASALALYDPHDRRWDVLGGKVAHGLVTVNPVFLGPWLDALRPIRNKLTTPLVTIFRDEDRPEIEHSLATTTLADYAQDYPALLADLLMDADPESYAILFPIVEGQATKTVPIFRAEMRKVANPHESRVITEAEKDRLAERQARAAVALVRLGNAGEVWPVLRHSADPRLRSFIVNWLKPLGADAKVVAAALDSLAPDVRPSPDTGQSKMDAILFHPETSQRRALILALGTYGTERLSPTEREPLIGKLLDLYRNDPDSGIHGAVEWAIAQWGERARLNESNSSLPGETDRGDRRWFVNSQKQTMAVLGPAEFTSGSPDTEPGRIAEREAQRRWGIERRYAISSKEVTIKDFDELGLKIKYDDRFSPNRTGPQVAVNFFQAAEYCNLLSEREGLKPFYLPVSRDGKTFYAPGMTNLEGDKDVTGYRLPTEAEWEYSCRAGTVTSRYYGNYDNLLNLYAWYQSNSKDHAWPTGSKQPNDFGLFDILGNAYEWTQNIYVISPPERGLVVHADKIEASTVNNDNYRTLRGGAYFYPPSDNRSAFRLRNLPGDNDNIVGFRVARTLSPTEGRAGVGK